MSRVNGFKQALELLANLDYEQAQKILTAMAQKDPEMAQRLQEELISLEDIRFITPKMLVELLREIELRDLALALRVSSEDLKSFIIGNVSQTMAKDIREITQGPAQPRSLVKEATERVMHIVRKKVAKREIIINKNPEEYV